MSCDDDDAASSPHLRPPADEIDYRFLTGLCEITLTYRIFYTIPPTTAAAAAAATTTERTLQDDKKNKNSRGENRSKKNSRETTRQQQRSRRTSVVGSVEQVALEISKHLLPLVVPQHQQHQQQQEYTLGQCSCDVIVIEEGVEFGEAFHCIYDNYENDFDDDFYDEDTENNIKFQTAKRLYYENCMCQLGHLLQQIPTLQRIVLSKATDMDEELYPGASPLFVQSVSHALKPPQQFKELNLNLGRVVMKNQSADYDESDGGNSSDDDVDAENDTHDEQQQQQQFQKKEIWLDTLSRAIHGHESLEVIVAGYLAVLDESFNVIPSHHHSSVRNFQNALISLPVLREFYYTFNDCPIDFLLAPEALKQLILGSGGSPNNNQNSNHHHKTARTKKCGLRKLGLYGSDSGVLTQDHVTSLCRALMMRDKNNDDGGGDNNKSNNKNNINRYSCALETLELDGCYIQAREYVRRLADALYCNQSVQAFLLNNCTSPLHPYLDNGDDGAGDSRDDDDDDGEDGASGRVILQPRTKIKINDDKGGSSKCNNDGDQNTNKITSSNNGSMNDKNTSYELTFIFPEAAGEKENVASNKNNSNELEEWASLLDSLLHFSGNDNGCVRRRRKVEKLNLRCGGGTNSGSNLRWNDTLSATLRKSAGAMGQFLTTLEIEGICDNDVLRQIASSLCLSPCLKSLSLSGSNYEDYDSGGNNDEKVFTIVDGAAILAAMVPVVETCPDLIDLTLFFSEQKCSVQSIIQFIRKTSSTWKQQQQWQQNEQRRRSKGLSSLQLCFFSVPEPGAAAAAKCAAKAFLEAIEENFTLEHFPITHCLHQTILQVLGFYVVGPRGGGVEINSSCDAVRFLEGVCAANRAGRRYMVSSRGNDDDDFTNKLKGIHVLEAVQNNIDGLYLHLRENPFLCYNNSYHC